jgi:hypothetical protein
MWRLIYASQEDAKKFRLTSSRYPAIIAKMDLLLYSIH